MAQQFGFTQLASNERRKRPVLGSYYYDFSLGFFSSEEEMVHARNEYIRQWQEDTQRLLSENPSLVLVD